VENVASLEFPRLGEIVDIDGSVTYTFTHARNKDYSKDETVNKGPFVEFTPRHWISVDAHFEFITDTAIQAWINALINQKVYVMDHAPQEIGSSYSTKYFTTVRLHDPLFLNLRVSQRFLKFYNLSLSATNLLDDYDADPFDPGPGRMFHVGLSARWE